MAAVTVDEMAEKLAEPPTSALDRRTERDQAANTLWLLICRGFVPADVKMREVCFAVGVSMDDLAAARRRYEAGQSLAPRAWRGAEPRVDGGSIGAPADWQPRPSGRYGKAVIARVQEKNPEPGMRRCSGCKQLLAVTAFDRKSPNSTSLRSRCRPCVRKYQRERYLTIRKAEAVGRAEALFTVIEGDGVLGMPCPKCDAPISVGDRVTLESAPRHSCCGAEVVAIASGSVPLYPQEETK